LVDGGLLVVLNLIALVADPGEHWYGFTADPSLGATTGAIREEKRAQRRREAREERY
jgi:hypothetical protein